MNKNICNKSATATFFAKLDKTYSEAVKTIKKLIEDAEHASHPNTEINFLSKLIIKLRIDPNNDTATTYRYLEELLKGGHFRLSDNGQFYEELLSEFNEDIRQRYSSHRSDKPQYAYSGKVINEVLFGTSSDSDGKISTWIQFEKHTTKTIIEYILHLIDYIKYLLTGSNFGPFGRSFYTENNPLVVYIKEHLNPQALSPNNTLDMG